MEAKKVTRFSENSKPPWALIALTPDHGHLGEALTSEAWLAPLETGTSCPGPALTHSPVLLTIYSRSPWKPSIFSGPPAQQTPSTAVSSVLTVAHSLACSAAGKSVPASGVRPDPRPRSMLRVGGTVPPRTFCVPDGVRALEMRAGPGMPTSHG